MTLEQAILKEQFEKLLERERQAVEAYRKLIPQLSDAAGRRQIQQLLREKQKHIGLIERLLEIVE